MPLGSCPLPVGMLGEGLLRFFLLGRGGVDVVVGERLLFWGPRPSIIMGPGAGLVLNLPSR